MSSEAYDFDTIVIGAGPAGESAALNLAKSGQRVAIVDDKLELGGNCTHWGTIPSKALRKSVRDINHCKRNPILAPHIHRQVFEYPQLLKAARQVIDEQVEMRTHFYLKNSIETLHGRASFIDQHHIKLSDEHDDGDTYSAAKFMLCTGSRPYRPSAIDFSHPRVYDSDTILEMQHTPRKLIIYGAGVIGCEYASIFSALDIKVDLINTRERLLDFLDDEITDALSYRLSRTGVTIRHCEEFKSLETHSNKVCMHLESGKSIHGDAVLWCNGRSGNTETLNLDVLGIQSNSRGQIEVDKHYQSSCENVFAAGDVIGWPSLASAAYQQGLVASIYSMGKKTKLEVDTIPTGIYTLPEISSIGKTERELTSEKVPYEVGRAFFPDIARGQIWQQSSGMLKLLFCPKSLQILGVHCFGIEATEIIHIGQAIMEQDGEANTIRFFIESTFNYPTMAEAYRIAALNGYNRLEREE